MAPERLSNELITLEVMNYASAFPGNLYRHLGKAGHLMNNP